MSEAAATASVTLSSNDADRVMKIQDTLLARVAANADGSGALLIDVPTVHALDMPT